MKSHSFLVGIDLESTDLESPYVVKQEIIYLLSRYGRNVDVEYLGEIEDYDEEDIGN